MVSSPGAEGQPLKLWEDTLDSSVASRCERGKGNLVKGETRMNGTGDGCIRGAVISHCAVISMIICQKFITISIRGVNDWWVVGQSRRKGGGERFVVSLSVI